jgi:O-antigen ligase
MKRIIFILFCIYFFLAMIPSLVEIHEGFTMLPFFAILIILLWLINYLFEKRPLVISKIDIYLWLFIIFMLLSLIYNSSGATMDFVASVAITIQLALLFLVSRSVLNNDKRLRTFLFVIVIGIYCLASLTILQHLGILNLVPVKPQPDNAPIERIETLVGGVNRGSLYFGLGILLSVGLFQAARSILVKIFIGVGLGLSAVGELLTYSVGGTVSLLAGFLVFIMLDKSIKRKITFLLLFVALGAFFLSFNPRITQKAEEIENKDVYYWGSTRALTWICTIKVIAENPILGVGVDKLPEEIGKRFIPNIALRRPYIGAHNMFLSIAGKYGLFSLFFFLSFSFCLIIGIWRLYKQGRFYLSQTLLACLATAFILVLSIDLENDKAFWVVLFIVGAFLNYAAPPRLQAKKRLA